MMEIVEINPEPAPLSSSADLSVRAKAGEALEELERKLLENDGRSRL